MKYFEKVKNLVNLNIADDLLIALVFEMSRALDKNCTSEIKKIQKEKNIVLDTPTRKILRKKFYYGKLYQAKSPLPISSYIYDDHEKIDDVFRDFYNRLLTYDRIKIIESMKKRAYNLKNTTDIDTNISIWLKKYDERRKDKLYSFVAIRLDQDKFIKSNFNENILIDFINKTYNNLENYRHLAIIVTGEIYNQKNVCITWNLLYKAGIFAEHFVQFTDRFTPFKKDLQIKNLTEFLKSRKIDNASEIATKFYTGISTGYKFEDCYISDNQDCKILLYKKIELDKTNIPCPSCNTTIQSGNSYPEMFLRSWECKNPSCPERSKSGRGKRFDEYGVYRYFKLVEKNTNNIIPKKLYQSFRRDIFEHSCDWIEFLIKEYTFSNEKIFMENCDIGKPYGRVPVNLNYNEMVCLSNAAKHFDELPIVMLFNDIYANLKFNNKRVKITSEIEIINKDSSEYLETLAQGQIGTAITSPPYYNAREYSQWSTLMMYCTDMMINANAVYKTLSSGSYYLYNIGDIVCEDNIYVTSNMSKHRIQLGFLSAMIFEIVGYSLTGNIIWDKGEVQSKRNSTVNLVSGYVKCINCYEHVLVFRKGLYERLSNTVVKISPVIKINCKGENTYKHTAPYPLELVELIKPYLNKNEYVLDPFLGSGTTLLWCKKNHIKGIGIELNSEYYELCKKNIENEK